MNSRLWALVGGASLVAAMSPVAIAGVNATSLFEFDSASGYSPAAGVITDSRGTIFGTTTIGGIGPCLGGAGCGTVYALSPSAASSTWTFEKLYDFQGGQDGSAPSAPLTLGADGTLYGYTTGGTPGTIFRLRPPEVVGGSWSFEILYVFRGNGDGNLLDVNAPLVYSHGVLYGIASGGSQACAQIGCGSVFRLTERGGSWSLKTLFRFSGMADSGEPTWIAGTLRERALYVSTRLGRGAVVALTPPAGTGAWIEHVLTTFHGDGDGEWPTSLVLGSGGVVFGIAAEARGGLVFELARPAGNASGWTRTTISVISEHGYGPVSLASAGGGVLIGAIEGDFDFFAGAVFALTPMRHSDGWKYSLLWNFNQGPDRNPLNVVTGWRGNLFGVLQGGDSSAGSLFELHR